MKKILLYARCPNCKIKGTQRIYQMGANKKKAIWYCDYCITSTYAI